MLEGHMKQYVDILMDMYELKPKVLKMLMDQKYTNNYELKKANLKISGKMVNKNNQKYDLSVENKVFMFCL